MNSNSLYIASMEANSGKLLVTLGIMSLLTHRFEKVAFFRPIIDESKGIDNDIELIRSRYCPAMSYKDCYAFEAEEVKTLATEGKIKDVYEKLLNQVNELYEKYDFVLCEGLNNSDFISLFDSNINLEIAKNLNIPFIGVINGSNQNSREIAEEIKIAESIIQKSGCTHFATFINRISDQTIKEIKSQSSNENNLSNSNQFNTPYPVFLLAEKNELVSATLADIKKALNANCVLGSVADMYRVVRQIKIAISSAETAKMFGIEPKVAMLSYSTGASGKGEDVDKVREATAIVQQKHPDLLVEGPIQYDAAISPDVAKTKLPDSHVAGHATVFIFPDLNTGNNTYKAVQRSSGAVAIGPVIQGLNKPVNDLSRGCLVPDIVNTVAITAIQAQTLFEER